MDEPWWIHIDYSWERWLRITNQSSEFKEKDPLEETTNV